MKLEIKISALPRDRKNVLVMSCPEPSLSGVVAIEYLVETLKMEEIGAVRISDLSPIITVINGVAKLPHRIFYDKNTGLVTVRQHVPVPPQVYNTFIDKILDWAEENKIRLVVCLSAMPSLGDREGEDVYFVTEEGLVDMLSSHGFKPLREATITGLEGAFLDAVLSRGIDGVLLLSESKLLTTIKRLVDSGKMATHRDVMLFLNDIVGRVGPDVIAALKLIKAVEKLINTSIDVSKLQEHAQKYAFLVEKNVEALFAKPVQEIRREVPLVF